jgi:ribosomal protein S18 acetylase RimI-like enzyme
MASLTQETIASLIRGWWHDPFEDMGYSAAVRRWGTYWSNGQVYVSDASASEVDAFLADLRVYFAGGEQPILVHLDTEKHKGRIGPVLTKAGCSGPSAEIFLFRTPTRPLPATDKRIQLVLVSQDNLAAFSDTKLRAWSSSEEEPSLNGLRVEIERRKRELDGSGRGMLARVNDTLAGFIWWHDESSRVRWITQVATRTPYRRQGLATRLIVDCAQTAYQEGMGAVVIGVDPLNQQALMLYEKLGFLRTGYGLDTYTYVSNA